MFLMENTQPDFAQVDLQLEPLVRGQLRPGHRPPRHLLRHRAGGRPAGEDGDLGGGGLRGLPRRHPHPPLHQHVLGGQQQARCLPAVRKIYPGFALIG